MGESSLQIYNPAFTERDNITQVNLTEREAYWVERIMSVEREVKWTWERHLLLQRDESGAWRGDALGALILCHYGPRRERIGGISPVFCEAFVKNALKLTPSEAKSLTVGYLDLKRSSKRRYSQEFLRVGGVVRARLLVRGIRI